MLGRDAIAFSLCCFNCDNQHLSFRFCKAIAELNLGPSGLWLAAGSPVSVKTLRRQIRLFLPIRQPACDRGTKMPAPHQPAQGEKQWVPRGLPHRPTAPSPFGHGPGTHVALVAFKTRRKEVRRWTSDLEIQTWRR